MRCEECLPVLEEYLDGELAQPEVNAVSAHMSACPRCTAAFDSLKSEQQIYSRYTREVEVTPLLWEPVRQRTLGTTSASESSADSERRSRILSTLRALLAPVMAGPRLSPVTVLLLIAIAIGATLWIKSLVGSEESVPPGEVARDVERDQPKTAPPAVPLAAQTPEAEPSEEAQQRDRPKRDRQTVRIARSPESTANQLVREAEQKYLAAIAILNRDVARRRKDMDPAVVARLDAAIAGIDRTIADTRKALRENPGDSIALDYMLTAYARKVDLLRDIANQ